VLYVTTKENAKVLQEEQDKRKLRRPDRKKTEEEKK